VVENRNVRRMNFVKKVKRKIVVEIQDYFDDKLKVQVLLLN
jgi:hypothetical protein